MADEVDVDGMSRRSVLLGLGAVAGAAAAAGGLSGQARAASPVAGVAAGTAAGVPEALSAPVPGLTYVALDAQQFWPTVASQRIYQDTTGSQGSPGQRIWSGLSLPAGSTIHQINVGYQGQPILEINKRPLTQPFPALAPTPELQKTLTNGPGGPYSSSETLISPIVIAGDASYTVSFYLLAGSSVFGCSIGYLPPAQSFVPYAGIPRVLDTRDPGPLTGKLGPGEERVVELGIAGARSAVLNLTVTETSAGGGFVAVFPAGVTWPGNSSINWSAAGQNVANGVITPVDALGRITIRGGATATHVIIDRIGYMI
jgi:hypothetical protein